MKVTACPVCSATAEGKRPNLRHYSSQIPLPRNEKTPFIPRTPVEYLEARYGNPVRGVIAVSGILIKFIDLGIKLFAISIVPRGYRLGGGAGHRCFGPDHNRLRIQWHARGPTCEHRGRLSMARR